MLKNIDNIVIFVGERISVVVYVCYRAAFNRDWFKKNSGYLFNQSDTKLKSITTLSGDFPALCAGYVYLPRVLIGSLCCLRLL